MKRQFYKGPKAVLIRDDDISGFTDVDQFRTVHRILLEKQLPFNAAVIPFVRPDTPSHRGGYEGFIPERFQGRPDHFPVIENGYLVSFLNAHPFIEVAQHGYSHQKGNGEKPEFLASDRQWIANRLEAGAAALREAFHRSPAFFVPPYDTVSLEALQEIRLRYRGISFSTFSHTLLPARFWPSFWVRKRLGYTLFRWGTFRMLQYRGLDFGFMPPDFPFDAFTEVFFSTKDYLVLSLHSWNFFSPDGKLKKDLLGRWEKILLWLLETQRVKIISFSGIDT